MNMDQTEKKEAAIPERAEITYFAGELQITEEKSSNDEMSQYTSHQLASIREMERAINTRKC